jgi:MoxR-like ATPase
MNVFSITDRKGYRKAGPTDLIQLLPVGSNNAMFMEKWQLEILVTGLCQNEWIHLSGASGVGKSSLIEALRNERNFRPVCEYLNFPIKPLQIFETKIIYYDSPGELVFRRALRDGATFDELSEVAAALKDAATQRTTAYTAIWVREAGRAHSPSIQGGLLDLMTCGTIALPTGEEIAGAGIGWIIDSNYAAETEGTYTLVVFDEALKRRSTVNLRMQYLSAEQEVAALRFILRQDPRHSGCDANLIDPVVALEHRIRAERSQGNLTSLAPPSIWSALGFLRMARALPHLPLYRIALSTLLGNASAEDERILPSLFAEIFGLGGPAEAGSGAARLVDM